MISVQGFTKVYDKVVAVDDLSFEVGAGDILGLVGPNGAGKTTTLRALSCVLPPTSGMLQIDGVDISKKPVEAKKRLAIIPDDPPLFASLTVWEHLTFTAKTYQVADWETKAEALLEQVELADRKTTMADELSRGMRQKVAMACALLHEPKALLLDEPLTGLDPRGIRTLYEAIKERAEQGAAVILSSHLLSQIEGLCTKFLILQKGKKLFFGTKEEIKAKLPSLQEDASLEEIFFHATESGAFESES